MANERALLKYRNPDSTQDINDRLAGLLSKGVFEGGLVTPVSGVLKVTLGAFSTVGSDGMFVKQSNAQTFDVVSDPLISVKSYVVIQQQYQVNAEPTIIVELLTSDVFAVTGSPGEQGANNPNMIVFGTVTVPAGATSVSSANVSYTERNAIDVLGRSHFRGLVNSESSLPVSGLNTNRTGDYFIVSDGSGGSSVPAFFSWNGSDWVNSTDTSDIQDQLDSHRGNTNDSGTELHVSTAQAAALSGAGILDPSVTNKYVLEDSLILPTSDQRAALDGNGTPLEDELPNATNPYVTSTKVLATPSEVVVNSFTSVSPGIEGNWVELGAAQNSAGYYVGKEAVGTAKQWFALYSFTQPSPSQYINDAFESVEITEVRVGDVGQSPTTQINTAGDTHIDDLGFFIPDLNPGGTLYLKITNTISAGGARASFGKRTHWGDFPPQFMIQRGPQDAQINTVLSRLISGTANAQFSSDIWDFVNPGQVAAWDTVTSKFIKADPLNTKNPVGVRGTANNLIQEGMLVLSGGAFPIGSQVYADKANPGSLTTTPNEWFIGTAISATILLVNMNGIPLQASGEVTPGVTFPSSLFLSVQEGQTVAFEQATGKFIRAETQNALKLPTGLRGRGNNVIISGLYSPSSGSPFTTGTKYFADPNTPGFLTTTANDWYVGVATASNQLLVNITSVPIPNKWAQQHDSNTGLHTFTFGSDASRPANPVSGTIHIRTDIDPPRIEYYTGVAWADATAGGDIPAGTRMMFVQNTVPTGWTFDSSLNDRVVLVTNILGSGGTSGGDWDITGLSADPHALDISEIPSHQHDIFGGGGGDENVTYNFNGPDGSASHSGVGGRPTELAGGGVSHSHAVSSDGTWRPNYVNVIICTKN